MHGMHTIGEQNFPTKGNLVHNARLTGKYPMAIENAVKKYGKVICLKNYILSTEIVIGEVVRIAPNELVFISPQAMTGINPQATLVLLHTN
jgi:hypothetical protein